VLTPVNNSYPPLLGNGKLSIMSAQRVIKARFILQRDEFAKAKKLALRNVPRRIKWAVWGQFGLLVALFLAAVAYRPNGKLETPSLIILVIVWLVFVTGSVAQRGLESLQFARMQDKEIWYEFDENGFRSGMPNSESRVDWAGLTARIETDKLFVLLSGIHFYTIPTRSIAAEEIASLLQLLAEKIPNRST